MESVSQEPLVVKARYHFPLLVLTMAFGCMFTYSVLDVPTLAFHDLHPSVFPAPSFQIHRGFVSVLRWLESLNTREDLITLGQLLTQARLQARASANKAQLAFAAQAAAAASSEILLQLSKVGLQCMLLLFLYRGRALSKKYTIPTLCLCVLSLLCWKMAQTCVYEILGPYRSDSAHSTGPRTKALAMKDSRDQATAMFLNALFTARYMAMCITNVVFGRAYQVYLCEPWPTQWKRIPAYLGSKNLVMSTLFFAAAGVCVISVTSAPLRSLCEGAAHIEALSLIVAFGHFVTLHFFANKREGSKVQAKAANE